MSLPLYGIDREIHNRIKAKYDPERERQAREYIETVTGESFPSEDFRESLKDGVLLCKTLNQVLPGEVSYRESKMPFVQMENIAAFLRGAEKLGMPKHDLFQTVDLYEGKNMVQVIDTIFSFSRHAVKHGFEGPVLGPKLVDKNPRKE
ncbi:uncharacterized protein VTP21DRAFT_655 [Calcarisporiella thermophila]|uniref:uncharacterized protein n=1 Tax=Calcarisporiella thermophila TaxID=911321 RepID=UPI00374303C3